MMILGNVIAKSSGYRISLYFYLKSRNEFVSVDLLSTKIVLPQIMAMSSLVKSVK